MYLRLGRTFSSLPFVNDNGQGCSQDPARVWLPLRAPCSCSALGFHHPFKCPESSCLDWPACWWRPSTRAAQDFSLSFANWSEIASQTLAPSCTFHFLSLVCLRSHFTYPTISPKILLHLSELPIARSFLGSLHGMTVINLAAVLMGPNPRQVRSCAGQPFGISTLTSIVVY